MTYTTRLKSVLLSWKNRISDFASNGKTCEVQTVHVEDYHSGYPRFSALIAAHDPFHLCRRFSNLRARLLLLKQDRLSLLEKQLERIDLEETAVLFLGSSRCDSNMKRKSILSDIDTALADYDALVERNQRMLGFEVAKPRDVLSLQNWVNGNACLAREETAYLTRCKDLLCVASSNDSAVTRLEAWVEDNLICFYRGLRENLCHDVSRDSNVYIFSGSLVTRATQALILSLITFLLSAPIIICNSLSSAASRIIVIIIFTIISLSALSELTKARTVEMFLAGATYATVLTVFITSTTTKSG
ncbi:MAG: hypothetical protein FRX48_02908 [Lasallia pustulata]|uniref:DUF6594 domain-containing protein n=1 Tax=Lasallia pustulata TaxID=136370 RepID=A0A5M8PVV3_9LECA|nr:MAG: hypothetical protein FRX48_02908 [Lasallia pustulata]